MKALLHSVPMGRMIVLDFFWLMSIPFGKCPLNSMVCHTSGAYYITLLGILKCLAYLYQKKDLNCLNSHTMKFIGTIVDIDTLLAADDNILLGLWLESAKSLAMTENERKQVNAKKVTALGKKRTQKLYRRHSARPGGMKEEFFDQLQKKILLDGRWPMPCEMLLFNTCW